MSELRQDPVIGRWVVIAPERGARPQEFEPEPEEDIRADVCPMCEGNERMTLPEVFAIRDSTEPDRPGWYVRVVPNKFPALRVEGELEAVETGLFPHMNGIGAHEIVIETSEHTMDLAFAPDEQIIRVLTAFRRRVEDLRRDTRFRHFVVFRNHRRAAGATLSHPHSQIIALPIIPKLLLDQLAGSSRYFSQNGRCIFCDIVQRELDEEVRIVQATDHFVAAALYASPYAYGVNIYPRRHSHDFVTMTVEEQVDLASLLRRLLMAYRSAAFNPPYNLVFQMAPSIPPACEVPQGCANMEEHYHWHIQVAPRLSSVAGLEWGTSFYINPVAPEEAAADLRKGLPSA